MKKVIFALALAIGATMAHAAQTGSVGVEFERTAGTGNAVAVVPAINALGLTFDAKLSAGRSDAGVNAQSLEARVRKDVALTGKFGAFVRGGVGKSYVDSQGVSFYSIEPGLTYAVTPTMTLNTSYRFADEFRNRDNLKQNTAFVGAEYAVTKVDAVGVRLFKQYGNSDKTGVELGYTRSF